MATLSPSFPAARLRRVRELCHWTQAELAAVLGVSRASVKVYEAGRQEPRFGTIARLLEATGLPLAVFTAAPVDWREVERTLLTRRLEVLAAMEHSAMDNTANHGEHRASGVDSATDNTADGAVSGPEQAETMDNTLLRFPTKPAVPRHESRLAAA